MSIEKGIVAVILGMQKEGGLLNLGPPLDTGREETRRSKEVMDIYQYYIHTHLNKNPPQPLRPTQHSPPRNRTPSQSTLPLALATLPILTSLLRIRILIPILILILVLILPLPPPRHKLLLPLMFALHPPEDTRVAEDVARRTRRRVDERVQADWTWTLVVVVRG